MFTFTFNNKKLSESAIFAAFASIATVAMLGAMFVVTEPRISHGQASDTATFRIRQTITDESTFLVNPANITMNGSINGVTGGQATGTTQFAVQSNNATGYYVEIDFFDNTGAEAMLGDVTASEAIRDYGNPTAGPTSTPTFGFNSSTSAQFAYTITSSTTADTGDLFLNDGVRCGAGSTQTAATCWMTPSTSPVRIVDRSTAASTGATSTLTFRVQVPSSPIPSVSAETYTATATLSLFTQ